MKAIPWIATAILVVALAVGWRWAEGLNAKLKAVTDDYAADRAAWADTLHARDARLARLRADSAEAYRTLAASRGRLRAALSRADDAEQRLLAVSGSPADSGAHRFAGDVAAVTEGRRACLETLEDTERALEGCESRVVAERERATAALAEIARREATIARLEKLAKPNPLRDFWRARAVTLPLLAAVGVLLIVK
jgi:septal ring factor EnvC (AmiA/AmiB activator)